MSELADLTSLSGQVYKKCNFEYGAVLPFVGGCNHCTVASAKILVEDSWHEEMSIKFSFSAITDNV